MLDKKVIWGNITAIVEEAVGSGVFHILVSNCYLESLEHGVATVAVSSQFFMNTIQRKALHKIEVAFMEHLNRSVKVKLALGHSRLFEHPAPELSDVPEEERENTELAMLHERYGDIMGIVDNHPVFKKATRPVEKGGWGIFPQLLTNACKDYGVMAILNGLRFIANRPSAINPRALFFTALKKGQFGRKLTSSVSMVG